MPGPQQNTGMYFPNEPRRSSADSYRFNGECHPQEDDRMLLQLFKEGDPSTLANNSRHGTQQQHQQQQQQQQQQQEQASSWMGNSSGYAPHNPYVPSNSYVGGPNITPNYNQVTGGFLEDKNTHNQDSSSSSESESSHSSQQGRYDSQSSGSRSSGIRMNKDEKLAREAGIKLDIKQDIVDPPMDEFNDMLSKEDLTEEQLNICRDIRRRGKNKVAAQNCRKRKLEQIDELQKKVDEAKRRQQMLQSDHKTLLRTYTEKVNIFTELKKTILNHHQRSSDDFEVVVDGDNVRILPKEAVPEDQRFPKSPESLRFRLSPPEDPFRNGNLNGYNLNNHQQHPYFNRVWDQNNI